MAEQNNVQVQEPDLNQLRKVRREKLAELQANGQDPFQITKYDAAKDEQRDIEARIEQIEKILKNAEVVDEDEVDLDKISVGCKVKVLEIERAN